MLSTSALYDRACEAGALVLRTKLPENKSLIIETGKDRYAIGLDVGLREGSKKHRTHLGHETGHASTGSLYNENAPQDVRQRHENDADKWTILNMVPEEELLEQIRQGRGEIWELSDYFGIEELYIKKAMCWYFCGTLDIRNYFMN